MQGKLIVITGLDGSGKTVQTKMLIERLQTEGYNVEQLDFPQYGKTFFADLIAKYLRGDFNNDSSGNKSPLSVNPYFTSLLYAGDRWQTVKKINDWIDEGKIVISNRYTCCNKAYQGAKINNEEEQKSYFEWVDTLEHNVYGIPKPNRIIFLNNEIDITQDLISKRDSREYFHPTNNENKNDKLVEDIHEQDTDYLKLVKNTYLKMASSENDWEKIECVKDQKLLAKDVIADKIWHVVQDIIQQ